ncbi:class I SAM-dependent methyltransferase [Nanoarchaeota archaeon]
MEYKQEYFDSGAEYKKKSIFHKIKSKIFSDKYSREHYKYILRDRWKYLKDSERVLDVGCGKCEFIELNPFNLKVSGIDINIKAVEDAKEKGFEVKLGNVNKKLPCESDFFEGIISSHVLEHIEDPTNLFSEIKRILKDKGKLVLIVPNYSFNEFYSDYTHKHPYTKMSLYRIFRDNGFENIVVKGGPCLSKVVGALFFPFPKLRFSIEMLLGKISPSEYIVVGEIEKD